jgi:protein-arginine kinase activator protein McsA
MLKFENTELDMIETVAVAKLRRCLMCGTDFKSAHAGERVCAKCRHSKAWREGETPSYGGGRRG